MVKQSLFSNGTKRDRVSHGFCTKGGPNMEVKEMTIAMIFLILKIYFYNAILRVVPENEKITAKIIYETIWTWFVIYTDEEKAGVMAAIQKDPGYCRKLMNERSGKDISYQDALALNRSLICQDGLEEAMEYCELDNEAKKSMIEDFKTIGIEIRPAFIAHDITAAIKNHIKYVLARKKRPLSLLRRIIETFLVTQVMMAYGKS